MPVDTEVGERPSLGAVLARGIRRRCPHCGSGRLFSRWVRLHERCGNCGLRFLLNQGDPWAFLLVVDRVFLIGLIAIIYFQLWPDSLPVLFVIFASVMAVFIATTPQRYGFCIALDYATRRRWGDPDDVLPPL